MTSFVFMFELVPEPVWNTSTGKWSSYSPAAILSPAAPIFSALPASSRPSSAFVRAAAALMRPSQWTTEGGIGWPEMGKFSTAFVVSPPQRGVSTVLMGLPGIGDAWEFGESLELRGRQTLAFAA